MLNPNYTNHSFLFIYIHGIGSVFLHRAFFMQKIYFQNKCKKICLCAKFDVVLGSKTKRNEQTNEIHLAKY